jgi:subtilisin family serine protease
MRLHRAIVAVILIASFSTPTLSHGQSKLDSSLRLLRALRNSPVQAGRFDARFRKAAGADEVLVTVKYGHVLSGDEVARFEAEGLSFFYINGEVARTRTIYPVRIPWSKIDEIGGRSDVLRMESAWRPAIKHPLDISRTEVEADSVWNYHDPLGVPLTGKGMRIADLDTGIDIFHPSFFYADGDTVDWLDVDTSGDFTPGTDAVDINDNDLPDAGETLRFTDGWIRDYANVYGPDDVSNDDDVYQTYWDWLYADTDDSGSREFGPDSGFTENDPTYGEPFFIALDDNDNGALDVGERLVALGTSKIAVSLNAGMVTRTRGVDLIHSDIDTYGHGTPVAGVLVGGTPGRHRFTGVAPDAEIIAGSFSSGAPISFYLPWARSHGADVVLHEWSQFISTFLDGSSLDEELITTEHASVVQVVPSGNLAGSEKRSRVSLASGVFRYLSIDVPSYVTETWYCTSLWLPDAPADLDFALRLPSGTEVALDDTVLTTENYYIWHNKDVSSRGTHMMDLVVERGSNTTVAGNWRLKVTNNSAETVEVLSNVADHVTSWSYGATFISYVYDNRNVCMPATSDSALVNGSYSTRGFESSYGVGGGTIPPGQLSAFSSRGRRIDGLELVDLCAPGNYDVFSARSHQGALGHPVGSYQQFSGTSAAGPFAAAAAALVLQAHPGITPGQVERMLTGGALADAYVGTVWSGKWGYGKLRILNALRIATAVTEMADGERPPALHLDQNYPNPFNPSTWIPFYLPQDGNARLTIYSVRGELVKVLRDRWYQEGAHSVRWDGRDRKGSRVASGVYFCVLRQNGIDQKMKMTLIR